MSKLSIKVVVAGRTYPLTVSEAEVEKVNKAADDINKAIKTLQEIYAVKDMQDLLAMTALQLATVGKNAQQQSDATPKEADFSQIESSLEELLKKIEGL
jgi:cell division protein ZapA (FtsZ GTPase activity inhibitor)